MYAVVMAGGGGTRLWPLSRDRKPKPFLPLLEDGGCLLAATIGRLAPLIGPADVFVVTDMRHAALVREAVPALPLANIIGEPLGRNTAAAVALAAEAIDRPDDEVM
ncbi:MAG TPA: sugar phosphate nucleotidyltransferase, partial [Candidatus Deferrimicrobium sp.]|nr:sugar phosphate nucleotidyltransferase [Candidatus Deferrimicrobium sp.]